MYVLNEYMEFGVDTPHIATYNFKLVFHLLFSTIYSSIAFNTVWFSETIVSPYGRTSAFAEFATASCKIRSIIDDLRRLSELDFSSMICQ